jgi:hypothetical protein
MLPLMIWKGLPSFRNWSFQMPKRRVVVPGAEDPAEGLMASARPSSSARAAEAAGRCVAGSVIRVECFAAWLLHDPTLSRTDAR